MSWRELILVGASALELKKEGPFEQGGMFDAAAQRTGEMRWE